MDAPAFYQPAVPHPDHRLHDPGDARRRTSCSGRSTATRSTTPSTKSPGPRCSDATSPAGPGIVLPAQGLTGAGGNIFRIRHDIDFLLAAAGGERPAAPRYGAARCQALPLRPAQGRPTGSTHTVRVTARSRLPERDRSWISQTRRRKPTWTAPAPSGRSSDLQPHPPRDHGRTGRKVADPGGSIPNIDVSGNEATWGQYLFPFGVNLGGISLQEFNEIDLNLINTPRRSSRGSPGTSTGGSAPAAATGRARRTPSTTPTSTGSTRSRSRTWTRGPRRTSCRRGCRAACRPDQLHRQHLHGQHAHRRAEPDLLLRGPGPRQVQRRQHGHPVQLHPRRRHRSPGRASRRRRGDHPSDSPGVPDRRDAAAAVGNHGSSSACGDRGDPDRIAGESEACGDAGALRRRCKRWIGNL